MKTICRAVVLMLALGICVAFAPAQETAQPKAKQPAKAGEKKAATPAMPMPKPAPEMQKLIMMFSGNWNAAEKHEAMEGMPAGSSTGTASFRPGPGRLSVVEHLTGKSAEGTFTGMGIFSWDPTAQNYQAYWCDNMTPSGCQSGGTGKWEGENLVFNYEWNMGEKKVSVRDTYTDIKPDSFVLNSEMDGKPAMTIKYTKQAAAKPPETKQ